MTNPFEKLLGLILNASEKDQIKYVTQVDEKWFNIRFQKDVFESIKETIKTERADIVNIIQWLRENGRLEKDYVYRVAGLTTEVGLVEMMNVNGLFNECYYHYSIRECTLIIQNVNTEILGLNPSSKKVLELFEKGISILTDTGREKVPTNRESINRVLDQHEKAKMGLSVGLDLGWKNLKRYVVLEDDDIMIVGGRPAMGKTAWAISLIRNMIFIQGKKMIFFSLEMSKERIMRRLISLILNIDSNKIKFGELNAVEVNQINELKLDPLWSNLHILDGSHSIKDIQAQVMSITALENIDLFCVDYLQKILPEKNDNRYQEVTKISNNLKRLVMSQRIPCIALAQLNRDVARSGKRPSLPDLKESGEIEQDASIVSFLHRPEYYGETTNADGESMLGIGEFIMAKNRDGEIGITEMRVNLGTSDWADYDRESISLSNQYEEF